MRRLKWYLLLFTAVSFCTVNVGFGNAKAQTPKDLTYVGKTANAQKRIALSTYLNELEKQYDVTFLYEHQLLDGKQIKMKNVRLGKGAGAHLARILSSMELGYSQLDDETYVLFKKERSGSFKTVAQDSVEGTVTDAQDGSPLPGVNILVKGTATGTATDAQGNYALSVPQGADTLVFSYIGYQSQNIPINSQSTINVQMQSQAVSGEELVVVGYGTQRKSDLTGSVSSVQSEDVQKIPTQSLTDALQGKVAGVRITPESGRPGSQPQVRIRGVGTLNDSSPLYVVDGMLVNDISFLNPKNVQSVEVLKDASATAIYGSRGANGVIIVTTKQGQAGKPQVSARTYYGLQRVNHKIDMANAHQFAMLANESAQNSGDPPIFQNPDQYGTGTNWQDLIFNDQAPIQGYNLTASGGSDNVTYSVSANYFKQDGVVRGSNFERVTLRTNNEYILSDHVNFGHNIAFTYNDADQEANDLVNIALRADPTLPPRNDQGEFTNTNQNGGSANPAASIAYNNNHHYGYHTAGNAYMNIDFLKNFNFKSTFGLDLKRGERRVFTPEFNVSPLQNNQQSDLTVTDNRDTNWLNENTLKYQNDIGDNSFKLLAGLTFQDFVSEDLGGSRINIPGTTRELWYLNAGQSDGQTNFNTSFSWGMISYLFRANYTYKDRYLLTATFRRDGSSRFASDHRWGNFPSFAVGWRISDEPFMQNLDAISNLKLRASWGKIGNDKIETGAAIPTVTSNLDAVFGQNQNIYTGATVTELANPDLKWEETEQTDIGLELGLFNDRLTGEVDWYRKKTNDILVRVPIPALVGVQTPPIVNAASVLNSGIDANVKWRGGNRDFTYSIGLTGSTVHNEVLSLGSQKDEILGGDVRNLSFTTRTVAGHPIGAFYGYKAIGVFQNQQEVDNSPTLGNEQPGDLKIADVNGYDDNGNLTGKPDGTINSADKMYLGSPIPDFNFGFNLSLGYKDFDFSLAIDGQTGNQIVNARKAVRGFRLLNYDASFLNRWHGEGTSNTEPRITESGVNYQVLSRFLEDGDYLRIRNIQLGYTLPVELTNSLDVQNIRFYLNANNLYTFTGYNGYTPQIGGGPVIATGIDNGVYPISSAYTFGIELNF